MRISDWDALHVGATLHLPRGNFYISTVQLLGTERRPEGIGTVWDQHGKRLTRDSLVMQETLSEMSINYTPRPGVLPVVNGMVVFPGREDWPEVTRHWFKAERGEHDYNQNELDKKGRGGNA